MVNVQLISINTIRNITPLLRRNSLKLEVHEWRSIDALLEPENFQLSLLSPELDGRQGKLRIAMALNMFLLIYFRTTADNSLAMAYQAVQLSEQMHHSTTWPFNFLLIALMLFSTHVRRELLPQQHPSSDL